MRWAAAIFIFWTTVTAAVEPVLSIPAGDREIRLRFSVEVDGRPAEQACDAFLDKLFAFADLDGNGWLNKAESSLLIPFLFNGFARDALIDKDDNGKITRPEFGNYWKETYLGPPVSILAPAGGEGWQANAILAKRLDRNGDGQLSRDELRLATRLLKAFDADEDETATLAEILDGASSTNQIVSPVALWAKTQEGVIDAEIRITPGKPLKLISNRSDFSLKNNAVMFPKGVATIQAPASDADSRLKACREFYLAPFREALNGRKALEIKEINESTALGILRGIARFADQDGDSKLTLAELVALFDLLDLGFRAHAFIRVHDDGAGLFAALDENHDGRLDLRELNNATRLIPDGAETVDLNLLPRRLSIEVQQGVPGKSFGPVMIPAKPNVIAKKKAVPTGPAWFQALDRNGDGLVSPQEFLGSLQLFASLDRNGDGFLSVDEVQTSKR